MLQAAWTAFEVRLQARAPELVAELRALAWGEDRYEDLGLLGRGGRGEVRRVRDRELNRVVACKRVRADAVSPGLLSRLVAEVQTTAQLQHPGIVPVYEAGRTADGGVYFTMKEVQGRELGEVIRSVHGASAGSWGVTSDGWSLRRLVGALVQASQAVGYAHERGVVHRDLKPSNVMVGAYGEVQVMDWGLAKVVGGSEGEVESVWVERTGGATRVGRVVGTPAYMPPEQALGEGVDARSDVYALGAMLYEVLTGRAPYEGRTGGEVLAKVLTGPPARVSAASRGGRGSAAATVDWEGALDEVPAEGEAPGAAGLPVPDELAAACEQAMSRSAGERYATAGAFAAALQSWLDGSKRREQALEVVSEAATKGPAAAALRAAAGALRAEAAAELEGIEGWRPEEDKAAGWAKEDEAAALEAQAVLLELSEEQLLQASLTHAPELPEAHAALAERYRSEHAAAEAARQSAARPEALLRHHLEALPESHPVRGSGLAYLKGDGALTLVTDPPGAEVELHRYELRNRRLVAVPEQSLGRTPLVAVPLARGSYLCVVRHPERAAVRYPVFVGRGEHWDGVPPEGGEPQPVRLPRREELGPDDCFVPAGWFWSGGDPEALNSLPRRRLWVDGQVLRRFPVTNREYLSFLDGLVAAGRAEEALRHAPRERPGTVGEAGALIYGFDGQRFSLRPDADGDGWHPEWPVFQVDWHGASAYAAWAAERSGLPWRLPGELEWEKAARGVDGRRFPWGDRVDPSWACTRQSHRGRPLPAVVDSYPVDESPYGVRGLGGNVRDWCADAHAPEGPPVVGSRLAPAPRAVPGGSYRVLRGGSWLGPAQSARVAYRYGNDPGRRFDYLGLRLLRSVP